MSADLAAASGCISRIFEACTRMPIPPTREELVQFSAMLDAAMSELRFFTDPAKEGWQEPPRVERQECIAPNCEAEGCAATWRDGLYQVPGIGWRCAEHCREFMVEGGGKPVGWRAGDAD